MSKLKKLLESVGISEENQELLEVGIGDMVSEATEKEVNERVALKEDELKEKYAKISEQYVEEQVAEQLEAKTKELDEKFESDKVAFEEKMVEYLDRFIDNEISENISDEALTKIAINETLKPVVDGIKQVFAENGLELNTDGEFLVKQLTQERDEYKTKLADKINECVELSTLGEKASSQLKLIEVTKDLDSEIATQVIEVYGNASFDEINEKAQRYAELLVEEKIKKENTKDETAIIEENVDLDVNNKEPTKKNGVVSRAGRFFK